MFRVAQCGAALQTVFFFLFFLIVHLIYYFFDDYYYSRAFGRSLKLCILYCCNIKMSIVLINHSDLMVIVVVVTVVQTVIVYSGLII